MPLGRMATRTICALRMGERRDKRRGRVGRHFSKKRDAQRESSLDDKAMSLVLHEGFRGSFGEAQLSLKRWPHS